MFSWSPTYQDDPSVAGHLIAPDHLISLVIDTPSIVRVLTEDFSTVLECVRRIDTNKDGKIVFDELKPLLISVLQEEQLVSATQALFEVLDINQDGFITAAELYAARLGLQKLIEQQAKQEADSSEHSTDYDDGRRKHSLCEKGASDRLSRAIRAKWRWVTYERWQEDCTLVELRRTRDENGDSAYSEGSALLWETLSTHLARDTYKFHPGIVDVPTHIDGSGALLESRVDQIVRSVADCKREVCASSHAADECTHFEPAFILPRRDAFIPTPWSYMHRWLNSRRSFKRSRWASRRMPRSTAYRLRRITRSSRGCPWRCPQLACACSPMPITRLMLVSRGMRCGQEQASTITSWLDRLVCRLA